MSEVMKINKDDLYDVIEDQLIETAHNILEDPVYREMLINTNLNRDLKEKYYGPNAKPLLAKYEETPPPSNSDYSIETTAMTNTTKNVVNVGTTPGIDDSFMNNDAYIDVGLITLREFEEDYPDDYKEALKLVRHNNALYADSMAHEMGELYKSHISNIMEYNTQAQFVSLMTVRDEIYEYLASLIKPRVNP